MTWLLTNDDGVFAPGIFALFQAVQTEHLPEELLVIAPQTHQSGCSHQVTTTRPLRVQPIQDQQWSNQTSGVVYAVDGTPADCVRVGHHHVNQSLRFILSGINDGANLGADIYISGTVAAVREAALLGLPGIALSQYRSGKVPIQWDIAIQWTIRVLAELMHHSLPAHSFWNVNFPHPGDVIGEPALVFCPASRKPLPIQFRKEGEHLQYYGNYAERDREAGSDVEVCLNGNIAITQVSL
jgi:5'-nucleotidase